ncbi:hypothetical protein [Dasania marina]|uniref:hypothetical protein n=1 Tax=Dasania marina TaxID=471499 RepID=UPI0004AFF1B3|nr:hypothetical protein [Dasania marina]
MILKNKYKAQRLLLKIIIISAISFNITAETVHQKPHQRTALSFENLTDMSTKYTKHNSSPVNNDNYLPNPHSKAAKHTFSGTITISETEMLSIPEKILPTIVNNKYTQLFPGLNLAFFSDKDRLIPVNRDIVVAKKSESFWQLQASPGKTWSEPGDNGYSRASFPFILTSNIENESYNGIASFIYTDKKISQLHYQIVHQLSPYMIQTRFVAWGKIAASYQPEIFSNAEQLKRQFSKELKDRFSVRPWSELTDKYPAKLLAEFDSGISSDKTVSSGLIIDNTIYAKPHLTPYGNYPYPEEMRHGVWSASKSMLGMTTALRMAQKYGDGIFDLKIKDYLTVTAEHDGWDQVTFGDALNMATGIGAGSHNIQANDISDGYLAVENQTEYLAWYFSETAEEKIKYVFKNPNYPWGPNQYVRYRDRDTFTLAVALDALLKEKEGPDANIWTMMVNEVFTPIGIHHLTSNMTKEANGANPIPFMGWGLYMTMDHIAKISTLLQNEGRHKGQQILSQEKLAEALYKTEKRGLLTGRENRYGKKSYHMSLWHTPYETEPGVAISIPEMHGFGGVLIALFPNKMTGFRIGNGGYSSLGMIDTANKLKPFK